MKRGSGAPNELQVAMSKEVRRKCNRFRVLCCRTAQYSEYL